MLDPQFLRDHPDRVREAITNKRTGDPAIVDRTLDADRQRRDAITALQALQQRQGELSKTIGPLMKAGKRDDAQGLLAEVAEVKEQVKTLEAEAREAEALFRDLMLEIPNVPDPSVPVGATPEENMVAFEWGETAAFTGPDGEAFEPLAHWELAERHGLIDWERGAKVAGAGFPFYIGKGARLQRALISLFLDLAGEAGYTEMQAPLLINEASGVGTGQIPDKEGQMYEATKDGLYMIPTGEVPVTNFHRDEIFSAEDLPVLYAAHTPCWRREAGSYGKDVRGLNRLHQFDKVELVRFCTPEASDDHLEALREDAERAVQALGLPYRRLLMCTGDMGFTQSKKYDLEVWSAGQGMWLEVSSISNFQAFQARRAAIRYRPEPDAKPEFVHTLNGSGLALPRILAAVLENNQQADGSIVLPEPLAQRAGFSRIG
ncbi:serine--tRNA ligase [Rubricoccus marinus]|uniref:Serine--tRNA ligase n=1 Tax=Rubricoccus marinus TaxID=716817 RepID=A0A259TZK2_9BACT|nr:serine--tRNA ligase [Rubricoccus marinus]OZC03027.1 serine--tRNA ligase [Rubricoccus marinus]